MVKVNVNDAFHIAYIKEYRLACRLNSVNALNSTIVYLRTVIATQTSGIYFWNRNWQLVLHSSWARSMYWIEQIRSKFIANGGLVSVCAQKHNVFKNTNDEHHRLVHLIFGYCTVANILKTVSKQFHRR